MILTIQEERKEENKDIKHEGIEIKDLSSGPFQHEEESKPKDKANLDDLTDKLTDL